jgi:penicillin-binding protein 1C
MRIKVFWAAILLLSALLLAASALIFLPPHVELPSFKEVQSTRSRSESILLDRHGEIVHELRTDHSARRLNWMRLDSISPAFISAILYAEDRRFYRHNGVDWAALA